MQNIQYLFYMGVVSLCLSESSCTSTTNLFQEEACKLTFVKGEMVMGIDTPNSCVVKYSDSISINPQEIIDYLCNCRLKKVKNAKFFGRVCIELFDDAGCKHLLVLSTSKVFVKYDGHYYKLKKNDAQNLDVLITKMLKCKYVTLKKEVNLFQ